MEAEKGLESSFEEVDTDISEYKPLLTIFFKILSIKPKMLRKYLPDIVGMHITRVFWGLVLVYAHPYRNLRCLGILGTLEVRGLGLWLGWLVRHDYIKIVKRPRLILVLGAYKMDKTYIVTKKGKRVIKQVLGEELKLVDERR